MLAKLRSVKPSNFTEHRMNNVRAYARSMHYIIHCISKVFHCFESKVFTGQGVGSRRYYCHWNLIIVLWNRGHMRSCFLWTGPQRFLPATAPPNPSSKVWQWSQGCQADWLMIEAGHGWWDGQRCPCHRQHVESRAENCAAFGLHWLYGLLVAAQAALRTQRRIVRYWYVNLVQR
jgi:hypothetical protein